MPLKCGSRGRSLDDGLLADYITGLHAGGKAPSTIAQAVAAVRWQAKNAGIEIVGEVTTRTLAGIRREGKDRGRGQADGLTWSDVERVCAFAEMDKSIAGLRDSALIRLMSDCLLRVSEAVAVNLEDLKDKTLIGANRPRRTRRALGEHALCHKRYAKRIIQSLYVPKRAGIESEVPCSVPSSVGTISSAHRLTSRSARRQITYWAELAGVEGFISLVTPFVSVLRCPLPKRGLRSSICRSQAGGSRHRCRRIMRKRSWQNGARLPGSKKSEGEDRYDLQNTQSDAGCVVCLNSRAGMRRFLGDRQRSVASKMRRAIKAGRRAGCPEAQSLIEEMTLILALQDALKA